MRVSSGAASLEPRYKAATRRTRISAQGLQETNGLFEEVSITRSDGSVGASHYGWPMPDLYALSGLPGSKYISPQHGGV